MKITIERNEENEIVNEEEGTLWDITTAYAVCLRSILDRAKEMLGDEAETVLEELAFRILKEPAKGKADFTMVNLTGFKRAEREEE